MDKLRNSDCWYASVCNQECSSNCIRFAEMKHLMDASGIPHNKQIPSILEAGEDYEEYVKLADIKDNIIDYVKYGMNLYICSSNTGNGKTSWAIKLMLKYFDEIWAGNGFKTRGLFVHVPTLLLKLKNFKEPLSEEYKRDLLDCDLVIWDDIAGIELSSYDYSQLLMYIDGRILCDKANIFTSNSESLEATTKLIGVKLASRIYSTSDIIRFTGKDRRTTNGTITNNQ